MHAPFSASLHARAVWLHLNHHKLVVRVIRVPIPTSIPSSVPLHCVWPGKGNGPGGTQSWASAAAALMKSIACTECSGELFGQICRSKAHSDAYVCAGAGSTPCAAGRCSHKQRCLLVSGAGSAGSPGQHAAAWGLPRVRCAHRESPADPAVRRWARGGCAPAAQPHRRSARWCGTIQSRSTAKGHRAGQLGRNAAKRTHRSPQRMRSTVMRLSALVGLPGSGKKGCVKMCRSSPSCSTTVGRSKRGGSGDLYVRQGRDVSSCCGAAARSVRGGAAACPAQEADHSARTAQGSKRH
jgi:hypothetical protein